MFFVILLYLAACIGVGKFSERTGGGFWTGVVLSLCLTPLIAFLMVAGVNSDSKH